MTQKEATMLRLLLCQVLWLVLFVTLQAEAFVINFDNMPSGSVVTTIGEVTFSTNVSGYSLTATDMYLTTSSPNSLGVNYSLPVFLPGESVTLRFASPINFLSVNFISSPLTPAGVFSIGTLVGSSQSSATPSEILADSGEVFPVSFFSETPFTEATLSSLADGIYSFNIDDMTGYLVPKPTTTTVTSALNPSLYGQTITFTATVTPSAATGTVTLKDGATSLGTAPLVGGTATYKIATLSANVNHSISAEYSGDTFYLGSTSAP